MKKALVYRRGGLGDTLLTFPILEILKNTGYHVTMVGNRDYTILAKKIGWADRLSGDIPEEVFEKRILIGINGTIDLFPKKREWIVKHHLSESGLKGYNYSRVLPFKDINCNTKLKDRIVFHPSSGSRKKNLPLSLIKRIMESYEVTVVAGEADTWLNDTGKELLIFDGDILRTASMLRSARLFIGADSGLSHLSAYLGVKTIIIYGPSDPVIWKPVGHDVIQIRPSPCPPCFPDICEMRNCLEEDYIQMQILKILEQEIFT